jgi:hypothetical protein
MPRLSDLEIGESIIQLYYGGSGTGKTTYCGSAGSRSLIINIGGGLTSIQSSAWRKLHPNHNPFVETIVEEGQPKVAKAFDQVCDIMDTYLKAHGDEIDTFIIDDITALRRFAMNKGLEVNQKLGRSKSKNTSDQYDVNIITVQDYNLEMQLIEQFVVEYIGICRAAKKHLIMTAHERITYNTPQTIGAEPTVSSIKPGFTGRTFPDAVTGYFDLVWHAEKLGGGERINYRARTIGDGSLTAHTKFRGIFPVIYENPDFLDVVKKIQTL